MEKPLTYTVWVILDPTKAAEQEAAINACLNALGVEYSSQSSTDE